MGISLPRSASRIVDRPAALGATLGRIRAGGARAADVAGAVRDAFAATVAAAAGGPGWTLPAAVSRVYDAAEAVEALGWRPAYTFDSVLERAREGDPVALQGLY